LACGRAANGTNCEFRVRRRDGSWSLAPHRPAAIAMNDAASPAASTGWPQWVRSVAAVALVGFISYLPLPLIELVSAIIGLDSLSRLLLILSNCLFPFLYLQLNRVADGGITDFPVAASVVQWAFLAIVNVMLVKAGVSKRPFLSALLLAGLCATLSLAAVFAFGLRFDKLFRT
jgi:hypothetical protein